jgi:hypothetical protein
MLRPSIVFAVAGVLAAVSPARAQGGYGSIPAWIESEERVIAPKFQVTLDGRPAAINSQLGPSSDQIIVLVLDVTGDPAFVDPARQALVEEISKLPHNAWVALLRAQDGLHVLADPGPDRRPVIDGIRNLPNSGNPGLLETVQPALALADGLICHAPVRVSVLYVTDSNIYNYREDFTNPVINQSDPHDLSRRFPEALVEEKISKLVDAAGPLEAPLFIIHLHDRHDRLNRAYENGLQTLAETTGGQTDFCRSVAEIPEAVAAAFGRISNEWRLTLALPPKIRGRAQVRLSGRSGDEELKLSWRERLEAKERQKNADGSHPNRSGTGY